MTPESILEQSKRAQYARQQCGFNSYSRENPVAVPESYRKDKHRAARVLGYLAQVFEKGSTELTLHDEDKRSRLIGPYMALCALKEYGFETASILNARQAMASDLCADTAALLTTGYGKKSVSSAGTHLLIPDFRVPQRATLSEERRLNIVYQAVKNTQAADAYLAIIPSLPRAETASTQVFQMDEATYLQPSVS